jgi:hypothetical protein
MRGDRPGGELLRAVLVFYPHDRVELARNVPDKGRVLIIESKGDDRDNSDSLQKIRLGNIWSAKAGDKYEYLMIFDTKQVDGAYRLIDAVKLISQM